MVKRSHLHDYGRIDVSTISLTTYLVSLLSVQHGKVKFGSLMGALKLVRTSTKLDDFDA